MVQFEAVDLEATKQSLLAASPLHEGEIFAAVNNFTLDLNPCNAVGFKHLVTVNIVKGNEELFGVINFITFAIGSFVKAQLVSNHQHITTVVESTLKLFLAREHLHMGVGKPASTKDGTVRLHGQFNNLSCCYCFSYRHLPALCRQPKPRLFSLP